MSGMLTVLFDLFASFFNIGMFSFGGGYAIIPLLQDIATGNGWLTATEFTDIVAISQVTPGPIAVNMATFVGYRMAGITGALAATFGVCMPALILVTVALAFIARVNNSKTLKGAFYGLRPAATGLIAASTITLLWSEFTSGAKLLDFSAAASQISIFSIIVTVIAFVCMNRFKLSPILVIICAAVAGMIFG